MRGDVKMKKLVLALTMLALPALLITSTSLNAANFEKITSFNNFKFGMNVRDIPPEMKLEEVSMDCDEHGEPHELTKLVDINRNKYYVNGIPFRVGFAKSKKDNSIIGFDYYAVIENASDDTLVDLAKVFTHEELKKRTVKIGNVIFENTEMSGGNKINFKLQYFNGNFPSDGLKNLLKISHTLNKIQKKEIARINELNENFAHRR